MYPQRMFYGEIEKMIPELSSNTPFLTSPLSLLDAFLCLEIISDAHCGQL